MIRGCSAKKGPHNDGVGPDSCHDLDINPHTAPREEDMLTISGDVHRHSYIAG
ncbi:MAG: hypothetical protein KAW09_03240 [Thermoplasmata archaeon]|nr:hypothetical protein [Thermoplasmata archaeon]